MQKNLRGKITPVNMHNKDYKERHFLITYDIKLWEMICCLTCPPELSVFTDTVLELRLVLPSPSGDNVFNESLFNHSSTLTEIQTWLTMRSINSLSLRKITILRYVWNQTSSGPATNDVLFTADLNYEISPFQKFHPDLFIYILLWNSKYHIWH